MTSEAVISQELADPCRLFRRWRAEHPKRHFPKEFWRRVARCAQFTDAKEIASALGMDFTYLRASASPD